MAEEKKITISRSLNGDTIYYIARNSGGAIFARELTLEKLEAAIKKYKEPPPKKVEGEKVLAEPKEKKFLINRLLEKVQERKKEQKTAETTVPEEPKDEEDKKFLESDLKTKVEERKLVLSEAEGKQSKKKSFWDKLK